MFAWKTKDGRWLKIITRSNFGFRAVIHLGYTRDINAAYVADDIACDVLTFSPDPANDLGRVPVSLVETRTVTLREA